MIAGIPFIGLATTEYVTVVQNDVSGYIHTDIDYLVKKMEVLLADRSHAAQLGKAGKKIVEERFNINRFINDWEETFEQVIHQKTLDHEETNSIYQ